ncbi:MAG: hypothetical protein Q4G03_10285 [Planctomycetia bacterium]|nr:hypothetical protein [Planctomycetia bacterium]
MPRYIFACLVTLTFALALSFNTSRLYAEDAETVGKRPYEMDWANRVKDEHEAIVDFETSDQEWIVETTNAHASFERSREEQIFGDYVGKLTYRIDDPKGAAPDVVVRLKTPAPLPQGDYDAMTCWICGNNWGWTTDPTTPRVQIQALFLNADGKEIAITIATVNWKEWFLVHRTLKGENRAALGDAALFSGFRILGGSNEEERTLYFDSICVFQEDMAPLNFKPRARPGIDLFEGQDLGINTAEERLPFPTREETILPSSSARLQRPMTHFYGDSCDFVYQGTDGTLVYQYAPRSGNLTDVTATWNNSQRFHPCANGGVVTLLTPNGQSEPVEKAELLEFKSQSEGVVSRWRLASANAQAEVEYRFQIIGKSLIVDILAPGGNIADVRCGRLEDVEEPRVFTVPYYLYDYGRRPGVALFRVNDRVKSDGADSQGFSRLFASAHIDWYRSGASYLRGENGVQRNPDNRLSAVLNGGSEYRPKTDGTRNDVYERFFYTISEDFDETLPNIPNPKSPYRSVAGSGVWRSHGATTREADKKYWHNVFRHGMRHIIVTDHEVCWRDGGESFTFRTEPAPGKGGIEGWQDYSRYMQDTLGFVYGPYNNFTDFAPVNQYWSTDMINRLSDGSLQHAWMRCYAPKPTRAVEYCEKLTPINQERFKFSCAYCDVHSSVPPWTRTDYDARVPGAGTFMSVFYPYGEIFLLQKQNWKGPTYSEGPHHCFYAGLTDGNYAQDQPYNLYQNAWLLNFDLLKIHEQEVDFGMGNLGMFAPGYHPSTPEEQTALLDRFICATLAFGHSGFFAADYGMRSAARAYFMTQQVAARYTQSSATQISYLDAQGRRYDINDALDADLVRDNRVLVDYANGVHVLCNGNSEALNVTIGDRSFDLPPNGYAAWSDDGALEELAAGSASARFDYCDSPEYIYLDARGQFERLPRACGLGAGVCRLESEEGKQRLYEYIPYTDDADLGFKLAPSGAKYSAVAVNFQGETLGPAAVRVSRGYVYVDKVEGAFSYLITVEPTPDANENTDAANDPPFYLYPRQPMFDAQTHAPELPEAEINMTMAPNQRDGQAFFYPTNLQDAERHLWQALNEDDDPIDYLLTSGALTTVRFLPGKRDALNFETIRPLANDAQIRLIDVVRNGATLHWREDDVEYAPNRVTLRLPNVESDATVEDYRIKLGVYLQGQVEPVETRDYALKFEVAQKRKPLKDYDFLSITEKGETIDPALREKFADVDKNSVQLNARAYLQRRGQAPTLELGGSGAMAAKMVASCGGESKTALKLHPPYIAGPTGRTFVVYEIPSLPQPTRASLLVGKQDGSDLGDGIKYQIALLKRLPNGDYDWDSENILSELLVQQHEWREMTATLPASQEPLYLSFIADANENPNGDWACLAQCALESQEVQPQRKLVQTRALAESIAP